MPNSKFRPNSTKSVLGSRRGASSWDIVLKVLSITLVSLLAFSSGVWFGKKLSDSDHQRQALEGDFAKAAAQAAQSSKSQDQDDADALTEQDVAQMADQALESAKAQMAPPTNSAPATSAQASSTQSASGSAPTREVASTSSAVHATAHDASHEGSHKPAPTSKSGPASATTASSAAATGSATTAGGQQRPDLSAASKAAQRVAQNAAPVGVEAPPPPSRIPSSLPKTVGVSNDVEFTVQVASYPTAQGAKEHVDELVKKGFPAFPVEAQINGRTWFRVSVGSFKSFNEAQRYRSQLIKQTDLPSAIVQKISR
jgi:hypothetical protein